MPVTETLTLKVDTKVKQALIDSLKKIGTEGKKGAKAADDLSRNIKKVSPAPLNRLATAANKANGGLLNMVKNTTLMGYNLQGIVLVAVNRLRAGFVDMTDQYNRVIGRMTILTGSTEEATRITHKLQEAAALTGWTLDNMSDGMGKLHTGLKQYGVDADRAVELTKNFGLWMRGMGDSGKRVPKVLGNLVTMFQRSTLTLEKLETLLGRGRAEQFLGRIGENYLKLAKIDLSAPLNKGLSAMQIFDREMKKGTISFHDFFKIFTKTIDQGALFGTKATEITHGWDQVKEATKGFITQLDDAFGGTKKVAGALSGLRDVILKLTKGITVVRDVYAGLKPTLKIVGEYLAESGRGLWDMMKAFYRFAEEVGVFKLFKGALAGLAIVLVGVREAVDLVFDGWKALFEFMTEVVKSFYKWIAGVVTRFEWLGKLVKPIVDAFKALTDWKLPSFTPPAEPPDKKKKTGTGTTGTTGDTGTGTGPPTQATPAQVGPAYQQYLSVRGQQRNLQASQAAGRETPVQYTKGLAQLNQRYKELLRTQAQDLRDKPHLTQEIQHQINATQHAADTYEMSTLATQQALDSHRVQIDNINAAYAAGDIKLKERDKLLAGVHTSVNKLLVTHGKEIKTYGHLRDSVKELSKETEKGAKRTKDAAKAEAEKAKILGQQIQQQQALKEAMTEVFKVVSDQIGAFKGSRPIAEEAESAWGSFLEGDFLAAGVKTVASAAQSVSELFGGKTRLEKKHAAEVSGFRGGIVSARGNLEEAFAAGRIDAEKYHKGRAELASQVQAFTEKNFSKLNEQQIAALDKMKASFDNSVTWVEKQVDAQKKEADKIAEMQRTMEEQKMIQQQLLDASKKQLAVMQIERDAALMEARLQSQANRDTVSTGGYGTVTGVTGGNQPVFNFAIEMTGDPTVIDARLKSDEGQRITLQTVQKNATETGEVVGASVA